MRIPQDATPVVFVPARTVPPVRSLANLLRPNLLFFPPPFHSIRPRTEPPANAQWRRECTRPHRHRVQLSGLFSDTCVHTSSLEETQAVQRRRTSVYYRGFNPARPIPYSPILPPPHLDALDIVNFLRDKDTRMRMALYPEDRLVASRRKTDFFSALLLSSLPPSLPPLNQPPPSARLRTKPTLSRHTARIPPTRGLAVGEHTPIGIASLSY
ncbi:hypothetical protein B0H17DRAFT_1197810 [Mycena rosella]|uniref:Uncharacterized protein n=1 Tax=Mycena rosella TaxID=1033263 RepID=A0AAD7DPL3_MYCRO|nr:hypothetical protein B0H17DRAFT_1197810 [Mycena rosella]